MSNEPIQAPFPLFGLADDFRGKREVNGVGRRGEVVVHVTLSHGLWTDKRVDVSVIGPLHDPAGRRSIDPLPMIAGELLNRTGAMITSAEQLERAAEDVLRAGFENVEIRVEGGAWPFRCLRQSAHWAGLHDLPGHHLLYVVASNVAPSQVELRRLEGLDAYG